MRSARAADPARDPEPVDAVLDQVTDVAHVRHHRGQAGHHGLRERLRQPSESELMT